MPNLVPTSKVLSISCFYILIILYVFVFEQEYCIFEQIGWRLETELALRIVAGRRELAD